MEWPSELVAHFLLGRRSEVHGKGQPSSLPNRLRQAEALTLSGMAVLFATTLLWIWQEIGRWSAAQRGVILDPLYPFTLPFGWVLVAIGARLLTKKAGKTKLLEDQRELAYRMKTTGGVMFVMSAGALSLSPILRLLGSLLWLTIATYAVTAITAVSLLLRGFHRS